MSEISVACQNIIETIKEINIAIIGIDGLGGAGKSGISEKIREKLIENQYHTVLLHIDDFINTKKVRYNDAYPDWQCYYDIQWRYDYFVANVINKIKTNGITGVEVELYDRDKDTYYIRNYSIEKKTIVIVEGIFLQRKELSAIFDFVIYIDIPEDIRLKRVLIRDTYMGNQQQIINKYENRYFPAEHKYINDYHPADYADYVIKEL